MPWAPRWLMLAAVVACTQAAPRPCVPEPRASEAPLAAAPPSAAPPASAPAPSEGAPCIVRGRVSKRSVAWKLRTRLDAIATMQVAEGFVTAELTRGARRHEPQALVQVENGAMLLRALVATEDLKVVLTRALTSLPGHLPDGVTHRPILEIEGDEAWVGVDIEGATGTVSTLSCSSLGLEPNDVGTEGLLPPSRGEVLVKLSAHLKTDDGFLPVRGFSTLGGVGAAEGIVAKLRGDDSDSLARRVSFGLCGGTVVGFVTKTDLLGPPKLLHGSNYRCPNTGTTSFVISRPLERPVTCANELPVFLRSATLEDPVGVLKTGTKFRVEGGEAHGTIRITVDAPPAEPFGNASFSVPSAALARCAQR